MSLSQFFTSVEFYVLATVVAAAVIGLCAKPTSRGPARTHLLPGILSDTSDIPADGPALDITCREDGSVIIHRTGLEDITDAGAVSLAITVIGFDISIEERQVIADCGAPRSQVSFALDFLAPEYYHVRYNSDNTGLFAAFTLHVKPGIKIHKQLTR